MTTITGINSQPTGTASNNSTTATSATPSAYVNPVNASPYSQLSSTAVTLSADSSIVATLSGSSTPLYTAVGLLNSITQAGQASNSQTATSTPSTTQAAQSAQDQALLNTLGTSSSTSTSDADSGLYTPAGTLQNSSTTASINSNWASILAATPQAAGALAADSSNQAIVGTL